MAIPGLAATKRKCYFAPGRALGAGRKEALMLSRWLTLGLALPTLTGAFACQNQGKAMGPNAIEEICGYESEAIEQVGCMAETSQCGAATSQREFFYLKCMGEQKIVAPRCAVQQQALADCFVREIEGAADRKVALSNPNFTCAVAEPTWKFILIKPDPDYKIKTVPPKCVDFQSISRSLEETCAAIAAQAAGTTGTDLIYSCTAESKKSGDVVANICVSEATALGDCSKTPPADAP